MSHDVAPARTKKRGLLGPFLLVGILFAAWCGWWAYLSGQVSERLDLAAANLRAQGYELEYGEPQIGGWPFRVRVEAPSVRFGAPSGHALTAPRLVAEANAYNPGRWVLLAPDGLTVARPGKGEVDIAAPAIRASISGFQQSYPNLAIELAKATFTPRGGAEPFPFTAAERVTFELRPAPAREGADAPDAAAVLFQLIDGQGRDGGPVQALAQGKPFSFRAEAVVEQGHALKGANGPAMFRGWSSAGGRLTGVRGEMLAGESRATLTSEALSVGADGRLVGTVDLDAEKATPALSGLMRAPGGAGVNRVGAAGATAAAAARGGDVDLRVEFARGRARLGPFDLAPAPKVF